MGSHTGANLFDSAIADVHRWLDEICGELGWSDRRIALHALRAALHALRDRLSVEQNAHLSAQLPTIVRGIYFEGWQPGHFEAPERSVDTFLAHIDAELGPSVGDIEPFHVARAVYAIVTRHVSEGEKRKVAATLPARLRILWEGTSAG